MQKPRRPLPPPRRTEQRPPPSLIRDFATRHSLSLFPSPEQPPSGDHPHGIAFPESFWRHSKTPPRPRASGPCSRSSHRGVYSINLGQHAAVVFAPQRSQTCFRNLLKFPPVVASTLTQLMDLTIRKVVKTPAIRDWGLGVLVGGEDRAWELNRKRWRRRELNRKSPGIRFGGRRRRVGRRSTRPHVRSILRQDGAGRTWLTALLQRRLPTSPLIRHFSHRGSFPRIHRARR